MMMTSLKLFAIMIHSKLLLGVCAVTSETLYVGDVILVHKVSHSLLSLHVILCTLDVYNVILGSAYTS